MSVRYKQIAKKAFRALTLVVFLGGMLHLTVITVAAIVYAQPNLLNPSDFLGIKTLFPNTESSTVFYFTSWVLLIAFYLFVFKYEDIRSHRYIVGLRKYLANLIYPGKIKDE